MSDTYSTGELAKLAGVSVRTVQYYDQRGILVPSELTEGGRRIYNDRDLQQLKMICFLREMDFSIEQIKSLLAEDDSSVVLELILQEHIGHLKMVLLEQKTKLDTAVTLLNSLKTYPNSSLETLSDVSLIMKNQKLWHQTFRLFFLYLLGIVVVVTLAFHWADQRHSLLLGGLTAAAFLVGVYGLTRYYYQKMVYLCPHCHKTFKPTYLSFIKAKHTPKTRKLSCPNCKATSYCLELAKERSK